MSTLVGSDGDRIEIGPEATGSVGILVPLPGPPGPPGTGGGSGSIADGAVTKPKLSPDVQASLGRADDAVLEGDPRLTDSRTPKAHTHAEYQTALQVQAIANAAAAAIVDGSVESLDTLKELAASLGNDPNFATTVTNLIGTKVASTDPRLTDDRVPLPHSADKVTSGILPVIRGGTGQSTHSASSYLRGNGSGLVLSDSYATVLANIGGAPKANPIFTGTAETPALKVSGGTPVAGKVWTATDGLGNGTWSAAAGGMAGIAISGTTGQTVVAPTTYSRQWSTAIGGSAYVNADGGTAVGFGSAVNHATSTALGRGAATTKADQIMLGMSDQTVTAPNKLEIGTGTLQVTLSTILTGGKAQLIATFATGAPIVIATQP